MTHRLPSQSGVIMCGITKRLLPHACITCPLSSSSCTPRGAGQGRETRRRGQRQAGPQEKQKGAGQRCSAQWCTQPCHPCLASHPAQGHPALTHPPAVPQGPPALPLPPPIAPIGDVDAPATHPVTHHSPTHLQYSGAFQRCRYRLHRPASRPAGWVSNTAVCLPGARSAVEGPNGTVTPGGHSRYLANGEGLGRRARPLQRGSAAQGSSGVGRCGVSKQSMQ